MESLSHPPGRSVRVTEPVKGTESVEKSLCQQQTGAELPFPTASTAALESGAQTGDSGGFCAFHSLIKSSFILKTKKKAKRIKE